MKNLLYRSAQGVSAVGASMLPLVAGAQTADIGYFNELVAGLTTIVNNLIPALLTLGLIVFLWGLIKFLTAAGNEDAAGQGKRIMIWGIIALFVMVTVWGLVAFLGQITGVTGQARSTYIPEGFK